VIAKFQHRGPQQNSHPPIFHWV